MHQSEDTIQAYLDRELEPAAVTELEEHLSLCDECRATTKRMLNRAALFAGAMWELDIDEPPAWQTPGARLPARGLPGMRVADTAAASTGVGAGTNGRKPAAAVSIPPARRTPGPAFTPALRWAAGIVLVAAAAGSAAVLGVPAIWLAAGDEAPAPVPESVTTAAAPAPAAAAVAVTPLDGAVHVTLVDAPADTRVLVRFTHDPDALVEVAGAIARFQVRPGAVTVDLGGEAAAVTVHFPRTLRLGAIRSAEGVVARTAGDHVVPPEAAEEGVMIAPTR